MENLVIVLAVTLAVVCAACAVRIWILTAELRRERSAGVTKSAFIRNLSNEIRTPLLSMSRQTGTLSRDDIFLSKDEKQAISGQMMFCVRLISTLLDEMMAYVEGGNGHDMQADRFSPTMLCRRCLDSNRDNPYLKTGVQLKFRREMDDGVFVTADMHIVELLLNKLIINACKFTEQGTITVGCNVTDMPGCLSLYVEDTGNGIPEERRNAVFGWFDHPEKAGHEVEFDLSVAQKMAVKLGGTLRIDPAYDKGTRLQLLMPLA